MEPLIELDNGLPAHPVMSVVAEVVDVPPPCPHEDPEYDSASFARGGPARRSALYVAARVRERIDHLLIGSGLGLLTSPEHLEGAGPATKALTIAARRGPFAARLVLSVPYQLSQLAPTRPARTAVRTMAFDVFRIFCPGSHSWVVSPATSSTSSIPSCSTARVAALRAHASQMQPLFAAYGEDFVPRLAAVERYRSLTPGSRPWVGLSVGMLQPVRLRSPRQVTITAMVSGDSTTLAVLDLAPNEASGLLRIHDPELLAGAGWDRGFWSVLDEVDVAECVAMIGHRAGAPLDQGWQARKVRLERYGSGGKADDAEALAFHEGSVYLFGSHHGGKEGPIRAREQWVARFRERDVDVRGRGATRAPAEVVNNGFRLHRLLNDALRSCGTQLVELRDASRRAFVAATVAGLEGTAEHGRVCEGDWTVNIEGAEVTGDGLLLLGLRFPVAADGRPLLVALEGWTRMFDGGGWPEVAGVWPLDAIGRQGSLAGVRDLCLLGDELHVVTGNLDSAGKGSVILDDYPEGKQTVNTHFAGSLAAVRSGDGTCSAIREFPDHPRIEGIAADEQGRFFYVSDEDDAVNLRSTPLIAGARRRR
ncbi:MAG TPA: hypothetical protein VM324_09010 [Egibacteraceae bacterium]|nr:hypothetical protein [Egibacteraceae bacterium]